MKEYDNSDILNIIGTPQPESEVKDKLAKVTFKLAPKVKECNRFNLLDITGITKLNSDSKKDSEKVAVTAKIITSNAMKAVPRQQKVAQDKKTEFTEEPAEKISGTIWTPPIMKNLTGSNESPKELKGPYSSNQKSPTDVDIRNENQVELIQSCANDKMGAQYQEYYEYPDDKMDSTGDDITLVKEVYQSSSIISPIKGFENDGSKKTVQTEEISISKTSGKPCQSQTSRRTHQKSVLMNNKRQEYQDEIGTTKDNKSGKELSHIV